MHSSDGMIHLLEEPSRRQMRVSKEVGIVKHCLRRNPRRLQYLHRIHLVSPMRPCLD